MGFGQDIGDDELMLNTHASCISVINRANLRCMIKWIADVYNGGSNNVKNHRHSRVLRLVDQQSIHSVMLTIQEKTMNKLMHISLLDSEQGHSFAKTSLMNIIIQAFKENPMIISIET